MTESSNQRLLDVAMRIREMRDISGFTVEQMAEKTQVSAEEYKQYEAGHLDYPFSFIYKCAQAFGIDITDLLEGRSAHLSSYTVTRKGEGQTTAREEGILIKNLAPMFRNKLCEPYMVKYDYEEELQNAPMHTTTHAGQEFDLVLSGRLKVQVGDKIEVLNEGDSILYNSSTPHGMIAVDGQDCQFLAVVIAGEDVDHVQVAETLIPKRNEDEYLISDKFVDVREDDKGRLVSLNFTDVDQFNFAYDIVDAIAKRTPDKLAMLHVANDMTERRFTFRDMARASAQCANYFKALGIKKGDRVLVVLKRHYQFWFAMLGLHKLGAIAIPATNMLQAHDFEYRIQKVGVSAIICTADGNVAAQVETAEVTCPTLHTKIMVGGSRGGWRDFDEEYVLYHDHFYRNKDTACGDEPLLMLFTSGTSGYPKVAQHSHKYPLGHYVTGRYWHGVQNGGLHLTISETGWGKALWGKLYGQWMCESAVFVYDFDRFDSATILPMFKKYNITSFCAPPTMLRMFIKQDISQYDLSSIKHMTTAGEALNLEVYKQFEKATGLQIREGFGQTEATLIIGNLIGQPHKPGSMGRPTPLYDVQLLDADGNQVPTGETGEICIRTSEKVPEGLFLGYCGSEEATEEVWHDGWYHTGDTAWADEDGFFWYVGRVDDVIKSSGYRIGPFEIESVIMELPYVLECGVSAAPDEVRGQVVKASIVLVKGKEPSEKLKKEIQDYVKKNTAPYKYPRIVTFRKELPKTISGKIIRNEL